MKIENIIGTLLAIAAALFIGFVWGNYTQQTKLVNTVTPLVNQGNAETNGNAATNSVEQRLDMTVLSQHATEGDCWLLISDKVYNVTSFLQEHPGGKAIILPYCGKDATTAFTTQAGEGSHSSFAANQLAQYYIGDYNMLLSSASEQPAIQNQNAQVTTTNVSAPTVTPTNVSLTTASVAQHATAQDCWIIVNASVYAVTNYLAAHPGGRAAITPYCGKDATTAFATQGGTGSHSSFASSTLASYKIGTLGSTTTTQIINATQNSTTAPSNEAENEDEQENEQEDDD